MQRVVLAAVIVGVVGLLGLTGCGGPVPYRHVDLDSDLTQADVTRYQREAGAVRAEDVHGAMTRLEHTDLWPLGLLAYWERGTATQVTPKPDSPSYRASEASGFGPLSILYVTQSDATFDAQGKRLSARTTGSALFGILAMVTESKVLLPNGQWQRSVQSKFGGPLLMVHKSEFLLSNGQWQKTTSAQFLHGLLHIHWAPGRTTVSLFSSPNPASMEFHGD